MWLQNLQQWEANTAQVNNPPGVNLDPSIGRLPDAVVVAILPHFCIVVFDLLLLGNIIIIKCTIQLCNSK